LLHVKGLSLLAPKKMEIKKKPRRVGTRERDEDGLEGLGVHQGAQQVGVVLRRGVEYQARVQGLDWVHVARTVAERGGSRAGLVLDLAVVVDVVSGGCCIARNKIGYK
jgi:hypothetical protein